MQAIDSLREKFAKLPTADQRRRKGGFVQVLSSTEVIVVLGGDCSLCRGRDGQRQSRAGAVGLRILYLNLEAPRPRCVRCTRDHAAGAQRKTCRQAARKKIPGVGRVAVDCTQGRLVMRTRNAARQFSRAHRQRTQYRNAQERLGGRWTRLRIADLYREGGHAGSCRRAGDHTGSAIKA